MATVMDLDFYRARRNSGRSAEPVGVTPTPHGPVVFCFDPTDPGTYFAAERVERTLPRAEWRVVDRRSLGSSEESSSSLAARASALRLPLAWPDRGLADGVLARRAARYAVEVGRAPEFVIAAARLAFGGGYDLDDIGILAEAAAAAGLESDALVAALSDPAGDAAMQDAAVELGVADLPAFVVRGRVFAGEQRLAEAAAAARVLAV